MLKYIQLSNTLILSLVYCKKKLPYVVISKKLTCFSTSNNPLKMTNTSKTDVIIRGAWCDGMVAKH